MLLTHSTRPEAATNMIDTTSEKYTFAGVSGPNGDDGAGSVCTTTATDADPDHGTSNYAESVAAMEASDSSTKRQLGQNRFHSRRTVSK